MRVSNPYQITEPAVISFSGGRTSAFMLHKILETHRGSLPEDVEVVFANTGKEMPATLDFVEACAKNWGIEIVWLQYGGRTKKPNSKNFSYKYDVVTYATAARNGEPFALAISDAGSLPNSVLRWCTGQLKVRTIHRYAIDHGFEEPYLTVIGIRADEQSRARKLHKKLVEKQDNYCPMVEAGHTKKHVDDFWSSQNFDLALPSIGGVTALGNCDLCFLKGRKKRLSIIREKPDLADWWSAQEELQNDQFDRASPSYMQMKVIAKDQGNLFDFEDGPDIACFCGD